MSPDVGKVTESINFAVCLEHCARYHDYFDTVHQFLRSTPKEPLTFISRY